MSQEWRALRRGESAKHRRMQIERAYELFLRDSTHGSSPGRPTAISRSGDCTTSNDPHHATDRCESGGKSYALGSVRAIVLDSWQRSLDREVNPDAEPNAAALNSEELNELRRIHPLASTLPVLERLLFDEAADSGFIVAVGDAQGRLLWVDGDHNMRSLAEDIGFVAGSDWSENSVGTSAPGSALALGHPIQVFGAEHFNRAVHQWSCAATPVHDPETGAILGVIDITGGETIAEPHVLPLVEATRAAVEAELKLNAMRRAIENERRGQRKRTREQYGREDRPPRLLVLGRAQALLDTERGPVELGNRHAEILLALSQYPKGLTAAALAEAVYGERESQETLRAELVRLRKLIDSHKLSLVLESRPYRLAAPLRIDAKEALAALERGAHRVALANYAGPALPGSDAPAVQQLRDTVDATLRESMLQSASPELLFDYAQQWAETDEYVWQTLLQVLPPLSPKRARVVAKLEQLQQTVRL